MTATVVKIQFYLISMLWVGNSVDDDGHFVHLFYINSTYIQTAHCRSFAYIALHVNLFKNTLAHFMGFHSKIIPYNNGYKFEII